jgi:hypothetical protein
VAFGPFNELCLPPSSCSLPHNHIDRLKSIPNEEPRRRPLAYYPGLPGADSLYRLLCIPGINIRDPRSNCRSKVRVASCHSRKTAPSRLSACPAIGNAEEVLGVVDLYKLITIGLRRPYWREARQECFAPSRCASIFLWMLSALASVSRISFCIEAIFAVIFSLLLSGLFIVSYLLRVVIRVILTGLLPIR